MSDKELRVLHCIPGLHGGGAERQLSYLAGALAKKGVDVHIAYHLRGPQHGKIPDSGVTFHELPSHGNHDPLLLWQLIKVVRKIKPDLIQTWLLQMDVLGGLAAISTVTPFVMSERTVAAAYTGLWKERLRFWIGRQATLIVANSRGGRDYWSSRKPPDLIKIVPNAVPAEKIRECSAVHWGACGTSENTEILLFAGRYSPEKNISALLDAFSLVLVERPAAMAILFGAGPLKTDLLRQVKRLDIEDRVKVMDYSEQLCGWMKRASGFISVSLFEGSPNAVCEAAASRCPLVLSDIPQHRDLLGDESAFFVSPDSPPDIARGILDLLCNPAEAKQKAQCAYARISGFTIDSVANQYLSVYELALKRYALRHL